MKIQVFEVPYDSGRIGERMGRGPGALMGAGLIDRLRFLGHEISITRLRCQDAYLAEVKSTFTLANQLALAVRTAQENGRLALVLSGNCSGALGTLAGLDSTRTGIIWFDAHAEFNTPETTRSGFLDGMGLAIATGRCWRRMAESISGFSRLPAKNIVLIGVRDIEDEEQTLVDSAGVQQIPAAELKLHGVRALVSPVFAALSRRIDTLYVHFDLDVLAPSSARWNAWVADGGLSLNEMLECIALLAGKAPIAAIGLASYDPDLDPERCIEAARRILDGTLAVAGA
jgi:arginase